ncbi:uncharacterized protein LOC129293808 [Prosopis cineraria]|uniref:uncharacterized protein LOC129293808 n=1 Tax=Prosopis cineraria TaxID=364024 RepID=UPI00240EAC13|nr:uncharacterized protein LOC129293808 [Prosopis cineraria]
MKMIGGRKSNCDCVDLEEGSWDSEDDLQGAPAGPVSDDLRNMNLITSHGTLSERNTSKRKRVGYSESERKKKQKVTASKKIADAENRIDATNKARGTAVNTSIVPGTSIAEVMAEILTMEAVMSDLDLFARCCHLTMFEPVERI